ncbi:MAG: hypothetical protein Q9163_002736 [Psora crenata]
MAISLVSSAGEFIQPNALGHSATTNHHFHDSNVPWQRVINAKGMISPRFVKVYSFHATTYPISNLALEVQEVLQDKQLHFEEKESRLDHLTEQHKLDQERTRERNQKHKWARGEASPSCGHLNRRPLKPVTAAIVRRQVDFESNKAAQIVHISRKHEILADTDTSLSDSSAEEDVRDASAAPEPDAGYTYSYDAVTGPAKGSQILGQALAKAVEKFETKATEKLVKDEYEVVRMDKEDHTGYIADEDGYELV